MALFIAKTQEYRAQEKVPAQIGVRYADLRPSRAENQAIGRVGELLMLRADEMKKERDAAVVGDLYNQWRDADREQVNDLLSRKGKDAINLDAEYDVFYNESRGEADQAAENGTQQLELKNILNRKREQNLDTLARYEAQEGQRYRNEQEIGFVDNAVADARGHGFDDIALGNTMAGVFDYVESAHPGMSPEALTALNRKYQSQILFANMQERINEDASRAIDDIERWKEELGTGYYKLKSNLKGELELSELDTAYNALTAQYGGNYEAAISEINNPASEIMTDLNFDQRDKLNNRFKGLFTQRESEEAEREEARNDTLKENDFGAWSQYYSEQGLSNSALDDLADKRQISQKTYLGIKNKIKAGPQENDPYVVGPIAEKLGLGIDIREDLMAATATNSIKDETFITMMGNNAKAQYKEGMGKLVRALKPTPADKYNFDKHFEYSEQIDLYNMNVRNLPEGASPIDVARDIVDSHTEDKRRSLQGLPTPRYFEGSQYNFDTVREAQKKTIDAYFNEEISEEQYSFEIRLLQKYVESMKDITQITPSIRKEIDSRRK